MSYFKDNYKAVRFPIATGTGSGLRRPQIGAAHAIAAHFTRHSQLEETQPAIVVMPTGSGKTAVLMLTAFLLQAERALVITPSKLVRAQVAEQFQSLDVLKKTGALVDDIGEHKVKLVDTHLNNSENWLALKPFDVVVSTPNCTSSAQKGVANPPEGLFDLLLIDEAHHVPAKTWTAILDAFPKAKKVLFTATPFRHDEKPIRGEIIYEFSIREAFKDKIFGEIEYIPVELELSPDIDIAIAKTAEKVLKADQQAGYKHFLLVRTDTRIHADKLNLLYKQYTKLNLRRIHCRLSPKTILQTIERLKKGELDGIICVDMLGEGFDFPNLKIAAIHRPHKSFPVTLQFIGRFARTGTDKLGKAKFIAFPQDIEIDMERLYKEGKVWQDIVPDLYKKKILKGEKIRKQISSFEPLNKDVLADLSLAAFTPLQHVKIYHLPGGANLDMEIELKEIAVLQHYRSKELSSLLFITEHVEFPDWTSSEVFKEVSYDLFMLYYDVKSHLLFINSSRRLESLYDEIVKQVALQGEKTEKYSPVPIWEIDRILRGLRGACFFNIGMVNRLAASYSESYRIIAGPRAQRALLQTDGLIYHRGHVYGRGEDYEDKSIMLGYSSSSRVWSNLTNSIPELVDWCRCLAKNIANPAPFSTKSRLDAIPIPEPLTSLPENIWFVGWNEHTYQSPPIVRYEFENTVIPKERECQLLDLEISIYEESETQLLFSIGNEEFSWLAEYTPFDYPYFRKANNGNVNLTIKRGFRWVDIIEYLNGYPLYFITTDQAVIQKDSIIKYNLEFKPFDPQRIEIVPWISRKVDIENEFGPPKRFEDKEKTKPLISIHEYLKEWDGFSNDQIVFYDHASGEIADFITFQLDKEKLTVALYHVKASGGPKPSDRLGDTYEVAGQVIKSMNWLRGDRLLQRITYRSRRGHPFLQGNLTILEDMFVQAEELNLPLCSEIVIVQPGISQSAIEKRNDILKLLASADDYLVRCGCMQLRVIASK